MGETDYGVVTISTTNAAAIIKREDSSPTKHDPAFGSWKTLIGNSDWEDHAQRKEGAEKYRVENLPDCPFCPGVYELGIVLPHSRSGRQTSKVDPAYIIPVYLGKSDNVRNRLQQYGRDGSHLGNGSLNDILTGMGLGPGLFCEIFAKGCSIAYRLAPMTNRTEAEETEAELLRDFDYAWNKGSNGPRRQNDILKRIDRSTKTPEFLQILQLFLQRCKGIEIKACKLPLLEDTYYTDFPPENFLAQVLKFGRSRPTLVPWRSGVDVCGAALGHGVVCTKPPSEGRKRCAEHKGMKINAASVCGVILPAGSSCTVEPVQGNKRCLEHKGRKVRHSSPQSLQVKKEYIHGPILDYNIDQNMLPNKDSKLQTSSSEQAASKGGNTICGADLEDGTFCTRQPPQGRKRCKEHKGIHVKEAGSKSFTEQVPHLFDSSGAKSGSREEKKNHSFLPSVFCDKSSPTCGMTLQNGGFCSRKPVEGNKRCWQHEGMRVDAKSGNSTCYESENHSTAPRYFSSSSEQVPYLFSSSVAKSGSREEKKNYAFLPSVFSDKSSPTCGMTLQNGGFCSRKPIEGNKRCWQHKGMRVDANLGNSICYESEYRSTGPRYFSSSSVHEDTSQTCGAPLQNGSYCRRRSNGRCWQHRADASSRSSTYNSYHQNTASWYSSYDSVYTHTSQTCGAPTRSGSYCRRISNGPCWQHGG